MPSITVRNLDADLKDRLRAQAAKHGCSMEEEARNILEAALPEPLPELETPPEGLGTAIHNLFKPLGGVELELPPRGCCHHD